MRYSAHRLLLPALILFFLLAPWGYAAAQCAKPPGDEKSKKPPEPASTVSAAAIKFGADLKEKATPELRKWVEKQVASVPRGKEAESDANPAQRILKNVEQSFPGVSAALQDTIVYMVFYASYESNAAQHETHAQTLKEIDREIARARDELRFWEQTFTHPPPGSMTGAQREMEVQRINQRLEHLLNRRIIAARVEAAQRQRVDHDLSFLNHGFKILAKLPPEAIRGVPAPKS